MVAEYAFSFSLARTKKHWFNYFTIWGMTLTMFALVAGSFVNNYKI